MSTDQIIVEANAAIDYLGGTSAVARMAEAPVSTVHSWRKNGIPRSRFAHLRLIAVAEGKPLPDDISELIAAGHGRGDSVAAAPGATGNESEMSGLARSDAA